MDFQELLNDYIELFSCTAKELADASGLTAVDISRYRTGKRTPDLSSPQLKKLAFGLAKLAQEHGKESITEGEIYNALTNALGKESLSYAITIERFNQIISLLDINISQMARVLNYDASYISRIRSKQRRPSDMHSFFHSVSVFIVRSYSDTASKELIANVLDCDIQHLEDNSSYLYLLESWFFSDSENMELSGSSANDFLRKLDEFNLDEYIRSIHFNDIKVPSVPFQFATSKNYFGLEAMKNGELDFLKSTVLSKSTESVYMCSDMPMEDMAQDLEFGKKWMFGLAVMLKKGLHLNIIHNIDRPFEEMMLGLESWIPLYMTGQISPYYLKSPQNDVYCHFHYVSGEAALFGECIAGYHDKGRYYLTRHKDEVAHYKTITKCLFQKAIPLMDIYCKERKSEYEKFLFENAKLPGKRHHILSSLPLCTMSEELLKEILQQNKISTEDAANIFHFVTMQKEIYEQMLYSGPLQNDVPELTREEFEQYPMVLSLSGLFFESDIFYTYEQYLQHLSQTKDYAKEQENYSVTVTHQLPFRNIQIIILEGEWVMVSKNKFPAIHFVIHHPKMCHALENMIVPVMEEE